MARNFLKSELLFLGAIFLLGFLCVVPFFAWASSCCGQSPASFTVLHQAEKLSVITGVAYTESLGRVYSDTEKFYVWPSSKKRTIKSLNFTAASTLKAHHQIFTSLNFQQGQYKSEEQSDQKSHFSDTLLGYAYEVLPEYSYSVWKPVVYLSALINIPTGYSMFDPNELSDGADVTGHNQWGTGIGVTARKVLFPITLTVQAKTLRLFEKKFERAEVGSFYDSSVAAFVSYATRYKIGLTTGLTWSYLSEKEIKNLGITSESSNVTTAMVSAQWTATDALGVGLAFSDQSLIGAPKNTILNRSYSINLNYSYF